MKKYAKSLKEYESIQFEEGKIVESMKRLKKNRKLPTSVALSKKTIQDLKKLASKKGVPYQVLMRMFILEGLDRMKQSAT